MKDFTLFAMKKGFYEHWGLPEIPFPVPMDAIESLLMSGNIEFPLLLFWLQEYSSQSSDKWLDLEGAMGRLAAMLAPEDDRVTIPVEGDTWFFHMGPVDLEGEIVTIQRQHHLVAAMQPDENGRLKVSVYRPLDAKACEYLVGLGSKPHPKYGINMRENNWEYALDSSAGTGNMYASERGESYLSYWQYGIGISSDGSSVPGWKEMAVTRPVPVNVAAVQVGVWYMNTDGLK